jgi:hypothetical protein
MSRRGGVKGWIIFGVIHKLYRFLTNAQGQFPALAKIWQALLMAGAGNKEARLLQSLKTRIQTPSPPSRRPFP